MTRSLLAPLTVFLVSVTALLAAAEPQPTATPEPRLTGGFGKVAPPASTARKRVEKKGVRITNDSLVTDPQKGRLTTSQRPAATPPSEAAPRTPAAPTPTAPAQTPAAGKAPPEGGEAYWRGEAQRLRDRVTELTEAIVRLESDTRKLEADFYSWDDGAYRDRVIKPAWDKSREDLATARQELPLAERALNELPERARRAGALPGWLRE
jgi:hypothetical protein